jgi:LmbE family N-acetylglucosaminyl deacetylase
MSFAENKKVLVIISHQDDESLFCGGLLSALCGKSDVTVICMSAAKQKPDVERRNASFRRACEMAGARPITTSFREARHVWSHVDRFVRQRPEQIDAMRRFLHEQCAALKPEIVITHNEAGEYGHCYHKVVHRVCRQVFDGDRLYFIGIGSKHNVGQQIVIHYDPQKKKELLSCYPEFDAVGFCNRFFGAEIPYQPESYVPCGNPGPVLAAPTALNVCRGLTVDFLQFWYRKFRSQLRR